VEAESCLAWRASDGRHQTGRIGLLTGKSGSNSWSEQSEQSYLYIYIYIYISTSVIWSHHKINTVLRRTAQMGSTKGMPYQYPSQRWFQSWTFSSHQECHHWGYVMRERSQSEPGEGLVNTAL